MSNSQPSVNSPDGPLGAWHLHDKYTIIEAALLIAGHDPAAFKDVERLPWGERPDGYEAVKTALIKHIEERGDFGIHVGLDRWGRGTDIHRSTVSFTEVRQWLADRGHVEGFFGRKQKIATKTLPGYLDRNHPRYAPKLAAAVAAWEAVEEIAKRHPKSPKTMLSDWLMEHAAKLDLLKDDGTPNREGDRRRCQGGQLAAQRRGATDT